jgi:hypothetical protein
MIKAKHLNQIARFFAYLLSMLYLPIKFGFSIINLLKRIVCAFDIFPNYERNIPNASLLISKLVAIFHEHTLC